MSEPKTTEKAKAEPKVADPKTASFLDRFIRKPSKPLPETDEKTRMRYDLITYLSHGSNIPAYPAVVSRLEKLLKHDQVDLGEVEQIASLDPGLVSSVVSLANTSIYGGGNIRNIAQSINRLGFAQLTRILHIHGAVTSFKEFKVKANWENFWLHSIFTAHLTDLIYFCYADPEGDEYTAGLLHDTGKLFLQKIFPDPFTKSLVQQKERGCSSEEAEFEIFGFTHSDVSSNLCMRWGFSNRVIDAVKYHHTPESPEQIKSATLLTACIAVANNLANFCCLNLDEVKPVSREELEASPAWAQLAKFNRVREFDLDVNAELAKVKAIAAQISAA